MSLAILTPFEGKVSALSPWLSALRAASMPDDTELIWLCNSADADFWAGLQIEASSMQHHVTIWRDTERIEEATAMISKDSTVARLWREMRSRIPADVTHVLLLEDDVIIGTDTITGLLALCQNDMTVVGAPVPEYVPTGLYMAWLHVGDPAIAQTAPVGSMPAEVDALSFGCMLYPRALFDQLSLRPGKDRRPPFWGYDNCAGEEVKALGGKIIAAWNLPVEHLARPGNVMPAPSPSSPAIFSTPEREFLRLAAMANPNWTAMQRIARTALSYGKLHKLAGLHQLEGVVAWRLCDDRMDGVAPNNVREHCRGYLDHMKTGRQAWLEAYAPPCQALDDAGIGWVTVGGPIQYAPLGIMEQAWPRMWDDLDIYVGSDQKQDAIRVVEACDFIETPIPHGGGSTWKRGEFDLDIQDIAPEHADREALDLDGVHYWLPPREWMLCMMAQRTICAYAHGDPLSLWQFGRLAAWYPGTDEMKLAEVIGSDLVQCVECGPEGLSWREEILWAMGIAERIYGFGIPARLAGAQPERAFPVFCHVPEPTMVQISRWVSDEAMIFDERMTVGLEARVGRGLWRRMDDEGRNGT